MSRQRQRGETFYGVQEMFDRKADRAVHDGDRRTLSGLRTRIFADAASSNTAFIERWCWWRDGIGARV